MKLRINGTVIELVLGDITNLETNAIVNPANNMLQMGGGVAGAISRKGGGRIQEECDKIGWVETGKAVITTGGKLKAKYVIHAVGPRHGEEHEDEKLKDATLNSLALSDREDLRSIAFPAISAGIFGFPKDRCAKIMLATTVAYLQGPTGLEKVTYCLYDKETFAIFEKEARSLTSNMNVKPEDKT